MLRAALDDLALARSRPRLAALWLDILLDDRLLEVLDDLDRHELGERDDLELPEDIVLELPGLAPSLPLGLGL